MPQAERELRRYLECGILACGFARARCDECGHDILVAFSCRGRAVCPACNTRRMAETAAHLVDHVLPPLLVRQWVLSLPKRLRYHLQRDRQALNAALRIFLDEIERHLRVHSPGAGPNARAGAVAFIHRFGSSLNLHTHFHVCAIDGVFEPDANREVRFIVAQELDAQDAEAVQTRVRRRILRAFVRRGLLDKDDRKEMEQWNHGGGFSLDATVRIADDERRGLEQLLRYCARLPFAGERIEELDRHRLIYHLPKPGPDGRTQLILSPLELIERIATLVPPPRQHRHRYFGVLAPNASLRAAVTALAPEAVAAQPTPVQTSDEAPHRCAARYLWAMLLARIYEAFPLACAKCGAEMRIVAFITEAPTVQRILDCPSASPLCLRGSPQRADLRHGRKRTPAPSCPDEQRFPGDPLAQPEPDYAFDQRLTW